MTEDTPVTRGELSHFIDKISEVIEYQSKEIAELRNGMLALRNGVVASNQEVMSLLSIYETRVSALEKCRLENEEGALPPRFNN